MNNFVYFNCFVPVKKKALLSSREFRALLCIVQRHAMGESREHREHFKTKHFRRRLMKAFNVNIKHNTFRNRGKHSIKRSRK